MIFPSLLSDTFTTRGAVAFQPPLSSPAPGPFLPLGATCPFVGWGPAARGTVGWSSVGGASVGCRARTPHVPRSLDPVHMGHRPQAPPTQLHRPLTKQAGRRDPYRGSERLSELPEAGPACVPLQPSDRSGPDTCSAEPQAHAWTSLAHPAWLTVAEREAEELARGHTAGAGGATFPVTLAWPSLSHPCRAPCHPEREQEGERGQLGRSGRPG
jgi:hypothetical protein